MKKTFLSMLMIASCIGVANAQLVVDDNGHVGVAVAESSTINSYMGVNSTGSSLACFYVRSNPAAHRIALSARRYGNNTFYALVADGQVIDTKRMILTK